jgi:hypothetical protein
MDTQQPRQSDPTLRAIFNHLIKGLRAMLPPPMGDTPDDLARRDASALAVATSLAPANAAEAGLTAQHIAFSAHAMYAQWLIRQLRPADKLTMTLRGQFASAERDARRYRARLLTLQEERYKREATGIAAQQRSSPHGEGQGAGGGIAPHSGIAITSPAQPPVPTKATQPASPRRASPAFRVIEGGLES